MCGIVGIASKRFQSNRDWLAIGRDTLNHRGPDDAGEWWSKCGRVGLGHRRLSILDLSHLGQQPMIHEDAGLSIVFNGEIYNFLELRNELEQLGHTFHSNSDTEVLLFAYAQWGEKCLARINGMFSFAIHDETRDCIFLARDRAGEKPLFYHIKDGVLSFASELKALLSNPALPRKLDLEALDCYLASGFISGNRCILQGYNKLPPAHCMTYDLNSGLTKVWRYWEFPNIDSFSNKTDETALLNEFEVLLENAVSRQLVADVPVGILLSGGLDSSLVTAMASRSSEKVKTFSVIFPGDDQNDESVHSRLIANYFGTDHMELIADSSSADLIPLLARQFDEPMVDSSMIPTWLISKLVREHCTVALGGDGADELFAGYAHYSNLLWIQEHLKHIPTSLKHLIAGTSKRLLPHGIKGRNYLSGLNVDLNQSLPFLTNFFDINTRSRLMQDQPHQLTAEHIREKTISNQVDLLQRMTRTDFSNYLAEDILVKVDRSSMHNSLEIRSPFLDQHVIEFAYGKVPSYLKADLNEKKIFLKKIAPRLLPTEFELNRKQGFSIPLEKWLKKGPYRDLFWDTLTSSDCMFDKKAVKRLYRNHNLGFRNGERLFSLVLFELWRKAYGISH